MDLSGAGTRKTSEMASSAAHRPIHRFERPGGDHATVAAPERRRWLLWQSL